MAREHSDSQEGDTDGTRVQCAGVYHVLQVCNPTDMSTYTAHSNMTHQDKHESARRILGVDPSERKGEEEEAETSSIC